MSPPLTPTSARMPTHLVGSNGTHNTRDRSQHNPHKAANGCDWMLPTHANNDPSSSTASAQPPPPPSLLHALGLAPPLSQANDDGNDNGTTNNTHTMQFDLFPSSTTAVTANASASAPNTLSNLLLSDFTFSSVPLPFPVPLPVPNTAGNPTNPTDPNGAWTNHLVAAPPPTCSAVQPPPWGLPFPPLPNPFGPPPPSLPFPLPSLSTPQLHAFQPPMMHSVPAMYQYQYPFAPANPLDPAPSAPAHLQNASIADPAPPSGSSSARPAPASSAMDLMHLLNMPPTSPAIHSSLDSTAPFDFPLFHSTPSLAPPSGPVPHLFSPDQGMPPGAPPRIEERVSTESAQCPDTNRIVTRTTTTRTSAAGSTTMTTTTTVYSMSSPLQQTISHASTPLSPGLVEDLLPAGLFGSARTNDATMGYLAPRRKRSASLDDRVRDPGNGNAADHARHSRDDSAALDRRPSKRARANSSSVLPGAVVRSPLDATMDPLGRMGRSMTRAPTAPPASRSMSSQDASAHAHRHTRSASLDPSASSSQAPSSPESMTRCLWFTCSATFSDAAQLVPHLSTAHTPANHNKSNTCKWGGAACGEMGNTRFASTDDLVSHLLETHIRAIFADGGHQCDQQADGDEHDHEHPDAPPSDDATEPATAAASDPAVADPDVQTQPTHDLHVCLWTECGQHFSSFSDLTVHVSQDHVGAKQSSYVCRWRGCDRGGRPFAQRQKVMRHLQMHTGWKPYECTTCAQRFSEHTVLMSHMRTHSGEKPFTCDFANCTKSFSIAGALTVHKRTHTGERPFVCKHQGCDKRFNESSNLTKHMRTHTQARPFRCPVCERGFARSDQAKRHLENVHQAGAAAAVVQNADDGPQAAAIAEGGASAEETGELDDRASSAGPEGPSEQGDEDQAAPSVVDAGD